MIFWTIFKIGWSDQKIKNGTFVRVEKLNFWHSPIKIYDVVGTPSLHRTCLVTGSTAKKTPFFFFLSEESCVLWIYYRGKSTLGFLFTRKSIECWFHYTTMSTTREEISIIIHASLESNSKNMKVGRKRSNSTTSKRRRTLQNMKSLIYMPFLYQVTLSTW